jgi:hypothetical protein
VSDPLTEMTPKTTFKDLDWRATSVTEVIQPGQVETQRPHVKYGAINQPELTGKTGQGQDDAEMKPYFRKCRWVEGESRVNTHQV